MFLPDFFAVYSAVSVRSKNSDFVSNEFDCFRIIESYFFSVSSKMNAVQTIPTITNANPILNGDTFNSSC